tara:strand:+ start:157 stop:390 length:234 start_codon:yes stop_codon:yes gene_type:complete
MATLLEQIKPGYVKSIENSQYTYSSSRILAKLESSNFYGDLTITEIRDIYDMCGINALRVSAWDMRFGDNLLTDADA